MVESLVWKFSGLEEVAMVAKEKPKEVIESIQTLEVWGGEEGMTSMFEFHGNLVRSSERLLEGHGSCRNLAVKQAHSSSHSHRMLVFQLVDVNNGRNSCLYLSIDHLSFEQQARDSLVSHDG